MSVLVDGERCNGCGRLPEPHCVRECPGNLMALDRETGRAYIREPRDCWDCMACVKACPREALETRLPYQIAHYKASLRPRVYPDRIVWRLRDVRGREEEFVILREVSRS